MALTASGIGSNLPIEELVSKLMSVESQPLQKLVQKESLVQSKISALGQVKSAVSAFQTALKSMQDNSKFNAAQVTSSMEDYVTVSGSNSAANASYSLKVLDLAQGQKLASAYFSSTSTAIGGGNLTFSFGTGSADGSSFAINSGKTAKTVAIPAGSTLSGIRDAVNKANIGVTASIVNDGTGNRLVFTAPTGTNNALKITTDNAGLSAFVNDFPGAKLTSVQAAKDARFELDGMVITKSDNTVSDVVDGLTFTLKKPHAATDPLAQVNVNRSTDTVKKTIDDFVKSYNSLEATLNSVSKVNIVNGKATSTPALAGDAMIRGIQNQIRSFFATPQEVDGVYTLPAEIGLVFDKSGTLTLNAEKFKKAIDSNANDVMKLFGSAGTPSDPNIRFVSASAKTQTGEYDIALTSVRNGTMLGATALSGIISIDASSPKFSVEVDGVSTGDLTLTAKDYTPAELAAELQSKINTGLGSNAKVTVSVDSSGYLLMSSSKTGTSSTVKVLSGLDSMVLSDLSTLKLFNVGAGTPGADKVSGTIGGYAALGSGDNLTGASGTPVEGLTVAVSGGTTGARGKVEFTKGLAFGLDGMLNRLLESKTGLFDTKSDSLNASIKDIGKQRDKLNDRLTQVEARYRKQFAALDTMVGQFQSTSNYLSQQLSALAN